MRTVVLAALAVIGLLSGCGGDDDSSITTSSTVLESTTEAPDPEAAVAAVARFYAAGDDWVAHVNAAAVLRLDGASYPVLAAVTDGAVADWDGDGRFTNADYVTRAAVSRRVFRTILDVQCIPSGIELVCTVGQNDLLYSRAGIVGPAFQQTFVVEEGLIVELSLPAVQVGLEAEAADEAWAAQVGAFERWINSNHSDEYESLFAGPCCPSALNLKPETAGRFEALLVEWEAAG